jgi:hypothetical protein
MAKKTDNHNPAAKLALRRYFLRKYHAEEPPHVLDCCQGGGLLWRELRKEFETASYWGLDLKPKKGRLKLDSVRVLQQPGWPQNVVDVDTYGSPWKHWEALLPNIQQPTTVFLTAAWVISAGFQQYDRAAINAVGIHQNILDHCPKTLLAAVTRIAASWLLARGCEYDIITIEAVEAVSDGNARYIGVRLEPQKAAVTSAVTPATPEHPRSAKETERV